MTIHFLSLNILLKKIVNSISCFLYRCSKQFLRNIVEHLIFEINPNKHTPLFIAPPPKCTNMHCKSGRLFIIAEAKQNNASQKIKQRWRMNDKDKKWAYSIYARPVHSTQQKKNTQSMNVQIPTQNRSQTRHECRNPNTTLRTWNKAHRQESARLETAHSDKDKKIQFQYSQGPVTKPWIN